MKIVERKDLVVGVEYILDKTKRTKAHYVGRNDKEETLFFMTEDPGPYFENAEGFVIFDTSGEGFFVQDAI